MTFKVWWPNPVWVKLDPWREFDTREKAERFMASRKPKYGNFPGYQEPKMRDATDEPR